jgi:hypothetical protein
MPDVPGVLLDQVDQQPTKARCVPLLIRDAFRPVVQTAFAITEATV